MDQRKFAAGDILFSEGDAGDSAFLVVQGAVQILRGDTVLGEIEAGQILGEMALINKQPAWLAPRQSPKPPASWFPSRCSKKNLAI